MEIKCHKNCTYSPTYSPKLMMKLYIKIDVFVTCRGRATVRNNGNMTHNKAEK